MFESRFPLYVRDLMTPEPVLCESSESLAAAARLLLENGCGALPVIESLATRRLVGVVTDRDVVSRAVAFGRDVLATRVAECMTAPAVVASEDLTLEECCKLMEAHRIRRLPVVNAEGQCCGMVSQADIALRAEPDRVGHLLRRLSQPTRAA